MIRRAIALAFVSTCLSIYGQEELKRKFTDRDVDHSRPLATVEELLKDKLRWKIGAEEMLNFVSDGGATKLIDSHGNLVVRIDPPEGVHEVIASRDTSKLLLGLMTDRGGRAYDYSRLLRISRDSRGWHVDTVLSHETAPMDKLHRWISELGALSNSGNKALVKLGEASSEKTPYHMSYSWQTWQLEPSNMISTGIRVPADFDD